MHKIWKLLKWRKGINMLDMINYGLQIFLFGNLALGNWRSSIVYCAENITLNIPNDFWIALKLSPPNDMAPTVGRRIDG